ncbi:MAG: glycosyltransferase family 4 protein [Planctomycetes bacterium]|nr:glycosyltransferase family 4 protein [Planctomycetota bacterium]
MKLVHVVIGKANPERANGVNGAVHGLATAQIRAGAEVEVWGLTPRPDAPTSPREYRLRLFRWSPWHRLDREVARALRNEPVDTVFHFHGGFQPEFRACAGLLAERGSAWVLTPHGAYREPNVRRGRAKKRLYLALFDGFLVRGARAVQCFSAVERDELLALEPRARIVVVPNGQALLDRPAVVAHGARPTFGFCGRLVAHEKGLDGLLDGFAKYVRGGGPGELRLVGDGPDRAALAARAQAAGLGERVDFVGPRFGEEKLALLAACDAFVAPSRTEGMPLAVLEAAALGLPCVVTRATNLGEPIERHGAGFVIEECAADAVATALSACAELHARDALDELGRRARAMITSEFEPSVIARRTLDELYVARSATALK